MSGLSWRDWLAQNPGMAPKRLPSQFSWGRWRPDRVRHWRPGDPSPDDLIWFLRLDQTEIAKIVDLGNGQWLVTVYAWCRLDQRKHAVADSERLARFWCERWAAKNADYFREKFPLAFAHPNGKPREDREAPVTGR